MKKMKEFVEKNQMIKAGDHVVLGVSGGADSVCMFFALLDLLERIPFSMSVLHVEHGIRGDESIKDAHFVENLCKTHHVPCVIEHVDVPSFANEMGIGVEEAARILRYRKLISYAKQCEKQYQKSVKVALAHHMEDNAETVIFQMVRGSGLTGMSGISPKREEEGVVFIRPLLTLSRAEIEDYLTGLGQSYCLDETNEDTDYSRNCIRHNIIPKLQEINDQAILHIFQMSEKLQMMDGYFKEQVEKKEEQIVTVEHKEGACYYHLNIPKLKAQHAAIQNALMLDAIAKAAGQRKDISSVHVEEVLGLLEKQSGRQVTLPYQLVAVRQNEEILIYKKAQTDTEEMRFEVTVSKEILKTLMESKDSISINLLEGRGSLELQVFDSIQAADIISKKTYTKTFDYDMIKSGFTVRNRREGDFLIVDEDGHKKKLKQYFINEKIPVLKRNETILLTKGSEVFWVIGKRIGENYKVRQDSRRFLRVIYYGG